ncbi:MAG: diphthine--ammonia ligase [Thermoplasmata archaeon]|nr:diphthine--ammonia ligase [Candidatus Sysuiplasma jiujiangense]
MKLAALFSGGKDSLYAMYIMLQKGHDIDSLLTVIPSDPASMMFHTPNIGLASASAECIGIRHLTVKARSDRELSSLRKLIENACDSGAEGIITGAIQSDYQYTRIDEICHDTGVRCFSPLWRKDELMLLNDIVASGIKAIIVSTGAEGFDWRFLGRTIDNRMITELAAIHDRYGVNLCGEGGEYETFVLDSPIHRKAIRIAEYRNVSGNGTSMLCALKTEFIEKIDGNGFLKMV